jgi:hypothetical protein
MKAQKSIPVHDDAEILRNIHRSLFGGNNKWGLRDLGTFLDEPKLAELAQNGLKHITNFTSKEIDWSKPVSKKQFLDFFYKNEEKIIFDPIIGVWVLTPLEENTIVEYIAKSITENYNPEKTYKSNLIMLKNSIIKGDIDAFKKNSEQIAAVHSDVAWEELLKIIKNEALWTKNGFPPTFRPESIWCDVLKTCPFTDAFILVLKWLKNDKITPNEAEIPLSELSNLFIHQVEKTSMLKKLEPLLDTLANLDAIKNYGFYQVYKTEPQFFEDKIDFYASYLDKTDGQPWARNNAIEALIRSHHPRSLYYLASRVFKNRYQIEQNPDFEKYMQPTIAPIEQLTQMKIAVQDAEGATVFSSIDKEWFLNYTQYWATHWKDYEWDEKRGYFINVLKSETILEAYDHLFRRLPSTNDSIAIAAYRSLTMGNPVEILPLADQYRQTIRSINHNLPTFKTKMLEQLTLLTDYCRDAGFNWELKEPFLSLTSELTPQARYKLENQLIEQADISLLSGLEYEALIRENNRNFSNSLSRIIDVIYARNWNKILENTQELRLFLKKATLFSEIGTVGTCTNYLQKFDFDQKVVQQILRDLESTETDNQILQAITSIKERHAKNIVEQELFDKSKVNENKKTNEFQKNIEQIEKSDSLSFQQLNNLFTSTSYVPNVHKKLILPHIHKLKPINSIRKLNPSIKFSAKEDFEYFRNLPLTAKEFASILRLFNGENAIEVLIFLVDKSKSMSEQERGAYYNEILRSDWIRQFLIHTTSKESPLNNIETTLKSWYESQENISAYEAENVQIHLFLLENIGNTIATNLKISNELSVEPNVKYKIERQLLSDIKFEDLKNMVMMLPNLSDNQEGMLGYSFLNTDFGFPPNAYHQMSELKPLQKNFNELSEPEFYKTSLRQFGVVFEKSDQTLDFQKIADMLEFDLVIPFSGGGGERRDWYVFALVKILEHHFDTKLGFHEKLNENQTFYAYNSGKRAQTWLKYLETKNLTKSLKKGKSWNFH